MATMARGKKKAEKFTRWDAAADLKTEEDMVGFLEACLEEAPDDAQYIAAALGALARAQGMSKMSDASGLTREGLYRSLSGEGNPSFDTVLRIMKALGLRFEVKLAKAA